MSANHIAIFIYTVIAVIWFSTFVGKPDDNARIVSYSIMFILSIIAMILVFMWLWQNNIS
jgi:hypothetical protein